MGLEHCLKKPEKVLIPHFVTIPHGGLGTVAGGRLLYRVVAVDVTIPHSGLGTYIYIEDIKDFAKYMESPSHPVGLELSLGGGSSSGWISSRVTIPHGGLGTLERLRDYVRKVKKSVAIPHSGLGTCLSFFGMFG